ncbi:hypothetical protein [Nitrosopumilus sp.]|uniref:hypothetical protein n=1 Tax=Nitrosopumilus sp. TaxID=2024843 RepID=UPI00292D50C0|nr:hypothetical protein [Nitrosopumilus sp.]
MTKNNNTKHSSTSLSCRIEQEVYDALVEDASKKGISLNSLMNNIAKHHITWKRYADEIGFVPITKRMLGKIFHNLDEDTITQLAKEIGGTVPRELLFLNYDKMSFENLMNILEINANRFGSVKHIIANPFHTLNIHHGINKKFSHFLAESHHTLADEMSLKLEITNADENTVCMKFSDLDKHASTSTTI